MLSPALDDVLLVGKLDGTLTALELQTGQVLWSFDSGAPLVSSGKGLSAGSSIVPHVFPGADGTLYRVQRGGVGAKIEVRSGLQLLHLFAFDCLDCGKITVLSGVVNSTIDFDME